jgi:hypothetical protein
MEPQTINQIPTTPSELQPVQQEAPKPQVEEPPVKMEWKKPLFKILIIGGIALALMFIVKGS